MNMNKNVIPLFEYFIMECNKIFILLFRNITHGMSYNFLILAFQSIQTKKWNNLCPHPLEWPIKTIIFCMPLKVWPIRWIDGSWFWNRRLPKHLHFLCFSTLLPWPTGEKVGNIYKFGLKTLNSSWTL